MNPKRMKALLIYPEVPQNTYWSFHYCLNFIKKKSSMPPLGLLTIAAMFPEHWDLKLVDMNVETLDEADIRRVDAVFISAMIVQKGAFESVVAMCNQLRTPVVAGGPYPTSSHESISGVDHFVLGEVETMLTDFIADFEAGKAAPLYRCKKRPDMADSVTPRFDLLKMKAYHSMAVQYSRGCPFKCEFCDIWSVYGNKPRLKSAPGILAEFDALYRIGWRGALFMVDDNFIGNKQRVKRELLPALTAWQHEHGYPFRLYTEASINMAADDELLRAMVEAGFNEVFIGIETPSEDSLRETGKSQNLKTDLSAAVQKIQAAGMEVMAGFIIGFDADTEAVAEQQIDFVQRNGIAQAMIGLLEALPGTELYKRLERENRIIGAALGNNTHNMATNFVTRMSAQSLRNTYKKVLSAIYDRNLKNFFQRCSLLLDRISYHPHFKRKVGVAEIGMLFRSLIRQPFTSYGLQYIKFIFRNAVRNPHAFGETIKFAIVGHHFYTITRETLKAEKLETELERCYRYLVDQIGRQSELISDNYKLAVQNLASLWRLNTKMFKELRGKMGNVRLEFRQDLLVKYAALEQEIRERFQSYRGDLAPYGIRV